MNTIKSEQRAVRKKYSPQFKDLALERTEKEGVPQVAKDLGLAESLLYSWKAQKKKGGDSIENQKLFITRGLVCSMSKRGDCFDNAAMESWNHSFKVEAIHGEKLATRALTKSVVFEYIEIYYNRKRLHSTIGYESPEAFEVKMVA